MRPSIAVLLLAVPTTVLAAPKGGTGGKSDGGDRLDKVTAGISRTVAAAGENVDRTGNRDANFDWDGPGICHDYTEYVECKGQLYTKRMTRDEVWVIRNSDRSLVRRYKHDESTAGTAKVDLFAGVMDTYESAGAANLAISAQDDHLRLAGSLAHYWEDSMSGDISMTMPTLALGRVTPVGDARMFLEGGVAYVNTKNPMVGSESMTGPLIGVGLDAPAGGGVTVGARAHAMAFDDGITAWDARFAVRFKHVEAAFRVLDFSTGPALFGPEVGVAF